MSDTKGAGYNIMREEQKTATKAYAETHTNKRSNTK